MANRTALYSTHLALGAKVIDFGGWDMPLEYPTHILREHAATRTAAGLFDTAHMGQLHVEGPGALESLQRLVSRDLATLADGQGRYALLTSARGTVLDDLIIFKLAAEKYFVVTNAGTFESDTAHISANAKNAAITNLLPERYKLDLQGPKTFEILAKLSAAPFQKLKRFRIMAGTVAGVPCQVSRSGYTGEPQGVEIFCPKPDAQRVWDALMEAGAPLGLLPCGLGARDTLRLESCLPLYGHELSTEITPLEADLEWAVSLEKDFLGVEALRQQKAQGVPRRLAALKLAGRQPARAGAPLFKDAQRVGAVTSGTFGPTVGCAIALGLVEAPAAALGTALQVEVRGSRLEAVVVAKPFYKAGARG
ncbi:MAG: glycine cleavage system aminomethyltransferase GcvT [Planctomycetota bacterium]